MKRPLLTLLVVLIASSVWAQVQLPPIATGTADPTTCTTNPGIGELALFYRSDTATFKYCSATNTWSAMTGTGGFTSQTGCTTDGAGNLTCNSITLSGTGPSLFTAIADPNPCASGNIWYSSTNAGQFKICDNNLVVKSLNPMTAAGDIITGGASGAPTRLAMGTALQVLRVNAGATALEYAAASGTTASPHAYLPLVGTSQAVNYTNGTVIGTANIPHYWSFHTPPFAQTFTKISYFVNTLSGVCGGTCNLVVAIYDAACTSKVLNDTNIGASGGTPDINSGTTVKTATIASTTLAADTDYTIAWNTNSTVLSVDLYNTTGQHTFWTTAARAGFGTQQGSTSLPASCEATTSDAKPMLLVLAN